jgi:hypothetical protein
MAGCATQSAEEDTAESGASDLTVIGDLGTIQDGETKPGRYEGGAGYRSFTFRAAGGDHVVADVTVTGGQTVASIADIGNDAVATVDNGTPSAHLEWTVGPPGPSRTLRIIFKDRTLASASYSVHLSVQWGACAPAREPYYTYHSTDREECRGLPIDCAAGERIFKNACGCGCERALQ